MIAILDDGNNVPLQTILSLVGSVQHKLAKELTNLVQLVLEMNCIQLMA